MSPPRHARQQRPRSHRSFSMATSLPVGRLAAAVVIVLLAVAYVVVQFVRPVPSVTASASTAAAKTSMPGAPVSLAWPTQGEAAIGIEGGGVLGSSGAQTPTPLASVAKLMTAYLVLRAHPLQATASGPTITITPADVATYRQDRLAGDSVVAVRSGEKLSELQALEALLIPSGDNIAALLADWVAGSQPAFVAEMNATAGRLGLTDTHYTDASGVTPGTYSTATSQVKLAMIDMTMPAFRAIVDMAQVTLPVAGLQYNVNALVGKHQIIGVKTGYTTSAGGCFVFAAKTKLDGKPVTLVGAVLHQYGTTAQPSALTETFDVTLTLLASADHALVRSTVVRRGEVLGTIHAPWTGSVALESTRDVAFTGLPGQRISTTVVLPDKVGAPLPARHPLGKVVVTLGAEQVTVPLVTARALPAVSLGWRLTDV
jgi:D-alanyl-D-alanine carboxypeptidase (penicillin-binding protein 5/6)